LLHCISSLVPGRPVRLRRLAMATQEMRSETPVVAEIASLLDQCSPDELANILQAIEGGGVLNGVDQIVSQELATRLPKEDINAAALGRAPAADSPSAQAPASPVAPSGPAPSGNARRPNPGVKRSIEASNPEAAGEGPMVSMGDMKRLLAEHSNCVLSEVRKIMPGVGSSQAGSADNLLDMETLTKVLAMRDREVKDLEARLSDMKTELSEKDKRVSNLSAELDSQIREVRHRQLDLEFQQLKLEERMRSNNELEQAQRHLNARVEEASLNARHAALDAEMSMKSPRSARVQGSLPWVLRKSRPVANGP